MPLLVGGGVDPNHYLVASDSMRSDPTDPGGGVDISKTHGIQKQIPSLSSKNETTPPIMQKNNTKCQLHTKQMRIIDIPSSQVQKCDCFHKSAWSESLKDMGYIRIPHIIIQKLGRFNMTQHITTSRGSMREVNSHLRPILGLTQDWRPPTHGRVKAVAVAVAGGLLETDTPLSMYMGVSENRGIPKSSILIGFSIMNHPLWGIPIFGNTHILRSFCFPKAFSFRFFGRHFLGRKKKYIIPPDNWPEDSQRSCLQVSGLQ